MITIKELDEHCRIYNRNIQVKRFKDGYIGFYIKKEGYAVKKVAI